MARSTQRYSIHLARTLLKSDERRNAMLNILITVYLVVFALMMHEALEEEMKRIDSTSRPFAWYLYVALALRWLIWPLLSIAQLIYIIVKAVKK